MGSQPGTQQRPKALGGVDMNLIKAVPVFVAGVLTPAMAHGTVIKPPCHQPLVDVVLISVNAGSGGDEPLDQRTNRGLSDVLQHPHHHRSAPLDHPENRWLLLLQGSPAPRALQAAPTISAAFFFTAPGRPLCPATT